MPLENVPRPGSPIPLPKHDEWPLVHCSLESSIAQPFENTQAGEDELLDDIRREKVLDQTDFLIQIEV